MTRISGVGLVILTLPCLSCSHGSGRLPANDWIEIRVDPTVELFGTELLNWVEERKGQLRDRELPMSETQRRAEYRKSSRKRRRGW